MKTKKRKTAKRSPKKPRDTMVNMTLTLDYGLRARVVEIAHLAGTDVATTLQVLIVTAMVMGRNIARDSLKGAPTVP